MKKISMMLKGLVGGLQNVVATGGGVEKIAELVDEYKLQELTVLVAPRRL